MANEGIFEEEYKKLNKHQKEAVEAIDGPVMVVAGPGTGKTQVLALRIANILKKTDIKADGILCLTFTNSAVEAMRERLVRYIGEAGDKVNIFTFHSFGMKVIEEHYKVLGLETAPKLLEDADRAILFDEVLNGNDWQYLRPRSDSTRYYGDLKSLISLLKRDRITSEFFLSEIKKEIKSLQKDPENLSSRGESKGQLKKEIVGKIESLERTVEVAEFINIYEEKKSEQNVLDYDDVLEGLVK
ncbi:MAG: UvrD-helicase domain-containing protein, partial [Minisyncoccia bacterium]